MRVGKNMMDGVPQTNSFRADRTDSIQKMTGPLCFFEKQSSNGSI